MGGGAFSTVEPPLRSLKRKEKESLAHLHGLECGSEVKGTAVWFQGPSLALVLAHSFRRETLFLASEHLERCFRKPADAARERITEGPEGSDHKENRNNLRGTHCSGACEPDRSGH